MKITLDDRKNPYLENLYKRLFRVGAHIRDRCNNPNNSEYYNYGGRGVTYDPKWNSTEGFIDDVDSIVGWNEENFLKRKIQLDKDLKYNNNKIYSKNTCMWVSRKSNMQRQPSRQKRFGSFNLYTNEYEEHYSVREFCRNKDLNSSVAYSVLHGRKHRVGDWVIWYLENESPVVTYYYASNKSGDFFKEINIERLAKSIGCVSSTVQRGFKKKAPCCKGWKLYKKSINLDALRSRD